MLPNALVEAGLGAESPRFVRSRVGKPATRADSQAPAHTVSIRLAEALEPLRLESLRETSQVLELRTTFFSLPQPLPIPAS